MKKKLVILIGIIGIAIIGYMLYEFFVENSVSIKKVLEKSDFSELSPPNKLAAPGSIVYVNPTNKNVLKIICPCESAFGNQVKSKYVESKSTDINLTKDINTKFDLNLSALPSFGAKTDLIKKVTLTLSNVKVLELPDDVVFELVQERSSYCSKAMAYRIQDGYGITMIKRVLQADVEYNLEFSKNVDEQVKGGILEDISTSFQADQTNTKTNKIIGKDLYWGVDDDATLAQVLSEDTNPDSRVLGNPRSKTKQVNGEEEGILTPQGTYKAEVEQLDFD